MFTLGSSFCLRRKLTNTKLRTACNYLGLNDTGSLSNSDLKSLLLRHFDTGIVLETTDTSSIIEMRKLFPSFHHTNGGFLFGLCKHGIVYFCKFLIRSEGSRDVLDAILSFKHPPKYIIYDDAGHLVEHARKRLDPEYFSRLIGDIDGRILEYTESNVKLASELLKDKRNYAI